jgi:hypothetical protein
MFDPPLRQKKKNMNWSVCVCVCVCMCVCAVLMLNESSLVSPYVWGYVGAASDCLHTYVFICKYCSYLTDLFLGQGLTYWGRRNRFHFRLFCILGYILQIGCKRWNTFPSWFDSLPKGRETLWPLKVNFHLKILHSNYVWWTI